MTEAEANEAVTWFAKLFTNANATQVRTLRDQILPYAAGDFRAAAEGVALQTPFANEAIVKIFADLKQLERTRAPKPSSYVEATDRMRAEIRAKCAKAEADNQADDALIVSTPTDDLLRIAERVLEPLTEDERTFYRAKGFLGRRCWRALVVTEIKKSLHLVNA
jgi:DNA-directed RNA polymerase specialized sigma24 family protein